MRAADVLQRGDGVYRRKLIPTEDGLERCTPGDASIAAIKRTDGIDSDKCLEVSIRVGPGDGSVIEFTRQVMTIAVWCDGSPARILSSIHL